MINLIFAEIYKESRKKSFKVFIMLTVFVSVFSLILINKNLNLESEQIVIYPQYSKEEYEKVNKYGSYEQYLQDYSSYEHINQKEIEKNDLNSNSRVKALFSYYPTFLFVIGIVIIYISFHIFSYDFQTKSIRYLFMSNKGRTKILFSKIFACILLSIFFSFILFITYLAMVLILTRENIIFEGIYIFVGKSLKFIPIVLYYFVKTFSYVFLMSFILVMTICFTIVLKGSTFALIISNIIYFCSLLFSQLLFSYGYTFIKYTFLPYMDFTYFENPTSVALNNLIYNIDLSLINAFSIMSVYGLVFILISLRFIKKDV